MTDTIEINYDMIATIKSRFSNKSQEIERTRQLLENHINDLRAGEWKGNGATAFYTEMDELLLPALNRLVQALTEAENSMQIIANEFQIAEEEASPFVDFTIA